MIDETELLEDLRHIRRRPKMWMRRGTFNDTCALIHGMDSAPTANSSPVSATGSARGSESLTMFFHVVTFRSC